MTPRLLAGFFSAALLLLASCRTEAAERVTLRGSGISVEPAGLEMTSLGSMLVGDDGQSLAAFIVGPEGDDAEQDPLRRALFPDPPSVIEGEGFHGNLYRRTRREHGGAWDGWWLVARRGDSNLSVQISYMGDDASRFPELRTIAESLRWSDQPIDSERAFGATTAVRGFTPMAGAMGGLTFTPDGGAVGSSDHLLLVAAPVTANQSALIPADQCEQTLGAIVAEQFAVPPPSGIQPIAAPGLRGCDAVGADGRDYRAWVVYDESAIVMAMGEGDAAAFREAMHRLHPVR